MKYALFCLMSCGFILSGCTDTYTTSQSVISDSAGSDVNLTELIHAEREQTAFISLRNAEANIYALELHNPAKEKIQAVNIVFTYPKHLAKLTGSLADTKIFPLHITSDNDAERGVVTLEIAQEGKAETVEETMVVYGFEMEKLSNTPFQLDIVTSEIMVIDEEGNLVNIANDALSGSLIVE